MIAYADQWNGQYKTERGLVEAVLSHLHIEARRRSWRGSVLVCADWTEQPDVKPICAVTIGPGEHDRWADVADVRAAVAKARAKAAQAAQEPEPMLL